MDCRIKPGNDGRRLTLNESLASPPGSPSRR